MKITKIDIPMEDTKKVGLEPIKMDRLGDIVLIAGKNGSGKSRILSKIIEIFNKKPKKSEIENANSGIKEIQKALDTIDENELKNKHRNQVIQDYELEKKKSLIAKKTNFEKPLHWNFISTSDLAGEYKFIPFAPKDLNLKDCSSFAKQDLITSATNINSVGIDQLPRGTFAKIQVIQDRYFESTHTESKATPSEKTKAKDDYKKLEKTIEIFFGTTLERSIDGIAKIFSLPLGQSKLSDGQKVLLQFCMAIFSQEADLKDLILVLDEPENHLHPSIVIETIDRLRACVSNGQIWIATHSIPILAHFDPSMIWYVENNKISHGGKIPEKVLESLLGDENRIAKLQDFISLPAQHATNRFALESLLEPNSVQTNSNDPQSFQIRTELFNLATNGQLKILDYGAGKGRLISNIVDIDENNSVKLIEKIDYIAFDKFPNDDLNCKNALSKAYGNSDNRYFNDMNQLLTYHHNGTFDVVIMCNVLHEIAPKEWLNLFKADGKITKLLKVNGILLLVEDQLLPIGEKAYQNGFLVLDTPQLKELFKITVNDTGFLPNDADGKGRLKAHLIPKNCLAKIDESSILKAIQAVRDLSIEKIKELRASKSSYEKGKLHGFWTQQLANATLILNEL